MFVRAYTDAVEMSELEASTCGARVRECHFFDRLHLFVNVETRLTFMSPSTRTTKYAQWVIIVERTECKPDYLRYATLLHRSSVGNAIMGLICHLNNATIVPSHLDNFTRSIKFYHETCPDYPFRWRNMFLLCIADTGVHYSRRVESIMMIIWRWFQLRVGRCLISDADFLRIWREKRRMQIVISTVREEIEWTKEWVMMYFNSD